MNEPLDFWSTPAVSQALATCDVPTLMDEIRKTRGWSQTDLADAVGYTQSWASKVLRRETSLTLAQVRIIIRRLGIPPELLRFGDHQIDEEDPTNRRQFGKLAALALLPSPRTALTTGENTATDLTAITGSQRRLDASFCSRDLIDGVRSHLELAVRAHRTAGPHAPAVAAAVSEAAGFAAWLSMDMLDLGSARTYYRQAITAAKLAKNDVLAVYMTGSLAAFEIDAAGDPLLGLAMIDKARKTLPLSAGSTPTAWLASLEALAHASNPHPDEHAATQAIRTAERAIARTDGPPPWPWVYPFDLTKLARIRASIAVRLGQPSEAARAFAESLPTAQPAPKQAALTTLEVATAACQRGETDEAFTLALDALNTGITYGSERIIRQARQFRYSNAPATTLTVARFDDRLRTTLLEENPLRIAISGHRSLPPATETLVAEALDETLSPITDDITGLTCLADGADTLFARAVLAQGGQIEVIVPAKQYLAGLPEEHHPEYRKLLAQAAQVHRMAFTESTSAAHMAASQHMLTLADELWAVWDGQPARGYGGTADVVQAAHDLNKSVRVIWPSGSSRD